MPGALSCLLRFASPVEPPEPPKTPYAMYRTTVGKIHTELLYGFIEVRRIGAGPFGSGSNHLHPHGSEKIAKKPFHRLALVSTIGRDPCMRPRGILAVTFGIVIPPYYGKTGGGGTRAGGILSIVITAGFHCAIR
ncbi:hypothetical protein BDM02DRAFT_2456266 [Thelephora ganbajun]|uniref:Uncharacterized protein n=1 Tax=Thelephora ganbajun TaxID=370292 RepID=A0ACB6ZEC7_THEGA|nr:hypothetical protein BDM02DRAFT_2456266 [Thelephora ganbajun]